MVILYFVIYFVILLFCYFVILLFCYFVILLFCYFVILLFLFNNIFIYVNISLVTFGLPPGTFVFPIFFTLSDSLMMS